MKKTLIALAALGAMAGVQAQSSVTLYGVVDAYIGSATTKTQAPGVAETKLRQNVINGTGFNSSRWGVRGSEDLGGGLSAVFTLESGFDTSNGVSATQNNNLPSPSTLFGRNASVGLKGGFGEARLGRQSTAYDALRVATNHSFDAQVFSSTTSVWGNGLVDFASRSNNSISYVSPDFAGFSGAVMYGLGEDKTATTDAGSNASLHIKYANGPLLVGFAHQREKAPAGSIQFSSTGTPSTFSTTRKYNLLGGSFDFGVAKLNAGFQQAKGGTSATTSVKDKEYQFGVSVPLGAAAVSVGYARSKSDGAGFTNKGTGFDVFGYYNLSKRTALYAGYVATKREAAATAGTTTTKTNTVGTGVRHTF